ncbi:MAG: 30S ribosomal protein S2 [Candidatus Bathyarchaeia archaeon]|nr:30S ribosomal protein S2 [Candidatus Bathyarchaeota archaeon]
MSKENPEGEAIAAEELLLPQDIFLSFGMHIGTKIKTRDMEPFIYKVRPDGLYVLDIRKIDERIRIAAKFLSRFEPPKIVATAVRLYAKEPVTKFCEVTRATPVIGRFPPGLFLNPMYPGRIEPGVVLVSDPRADSQAIREATQIGVPVVALCSTDNDFTNIDLIIPTNNKGRKALAAVYWLLARQILRERGEIMPNADLPIPVEDFEVKLAEKAQQE